MSLSRAEIAARVEELGVWFHNLDLDGVPTAPNLEHPEEGVYLCRRAPSSREEQRP